MLVLSRKKDQRIIIGDNTVITVVGVRGDQVLLGIDAPQSIPVNREEVWLSIQETGQDKEIYALEIFENDEWRRSETGFNIETLRQSAERFSQPFRILNSKEEAVS